MAKNQQKTNCAGACEKLYNATLRRKKNSTPALAAAAAASTSAHVSHVQAAAPTLQQYLPVSSSGVMIPIEFDPSLFATHDHNSNEGGNNMSKHKEGSLKRQESVNDKFSDYIARVKNRMMRSTTSFTSVGKISSTSPDSFDDNVSNYIRRAHGKMRATTTTKVAGHLSFDQ